MSDAANPFVPLGRPTPRPWRAGPMPHGGKWMIWHGEHDAPMYRGVQYVAMGLDEAEAQLIVQSVNAFGQLRDAARLAYTALGNAVGFADFEGNPACVEDWGHAFEHVRLALLAAGDTVAQEECG